MEEGERNNVASLSPADGGGAALGQGGLSCLQDALRAWGRISQSSSQSLLLTAKAEIGAEQRLLGLLAKNLKYLEDFCLAWLRPTVLPVPADAQQGQNRD